MARTSDSRESSVSDYWSASDHSNTTGSDSFKSWSSSAAVKSTDQPELDLLASETLSLSDEDCASNITPTFSEKSEAPQAAGATAMLGPQESGKVEDVAKQLDFGSATVPAQLSNRQNPSFEANTADASDKFLTHDRECCIRPSPKYASGDSQRQGTLYCEEIDSDSSSSHHLLQSTAASARPSCRRRAALDSDSDPEQVPTQCQEGMAQLLTQGPSTSVYTFDVSDSDHASDADTPQAGPSLQLESFPSNAAACQRGKRISDCSVIVLDSSDEEELASCRRHNHLPCSSDSDEEGSTSCKENLSPNQLATHLQSLHIRPPHTSVKPPQPPNRARWPTVPQSLPAKAKHTLPPPSSPSPSKAQSLASFKRERERLAYQLFRELNNAVFGGQLPADLQISWNVHLKTTAGLTHYSKTSLIGQPPRYSARVELSTKVIDRADKLQRTLCHELCHVATWLLDHVGKPPHGPHFKAWAAAAMKVHPHLDITTCHQYDIHFAWRWQCTNPECLQIYKRHSNSIDTTKQVCSCCRGQLQALGRFNQDGTPAKARAPSQYSLFVKENFASLKKSCKPGTPHKEIMQALSCSWRARAGASDSAEVADSAAVL